MSDISQSIAENHVSIEKLVLVVEDDNDLRQTIQWLLEDEGFEVEAAGDGLEALVRARQRKPALVLLDMNLPRLDGYGVARELHSTYGNTINIVTMTADGRAAEKAQRIGAISYLSKPFELDMLINTVRTALDMK